MRGYGCPGAPSRIVVSRGECRKKLGMNFRNSYCECALGATITRDSILLVAIGKDMFKVELAGLRKRVD